MRATTPPSSPKSDSAAVERERVEQDPDRPAEAEPEGRAFTEEQHAAGADRCLDQPELPAEVARPLLAREARDPAPLHEAPHLRPAAVQLEGVDAGREQRD